MRLGGIVLCGGQSRRMGSPKAWLRFGEETLLQRVVRVLAGTLEPLIVVSGPGQRLPSLSEDVCVIRDRLPGRGPLEGLATGLEAISRHADAAFVCGCDAPFLRPDFVRRLAHLAREAEITMPFVDGRLHPLAAVYRVSVLPVIQDMLDAGASRLTLLAERCHCRRLSAPELRDVDPELDSLLNVNTPEEYERALGAAGNLRGD